MPRLSEAPPTLETAIPSELVPSNTMDVPAESAELDYMLADLRDVPTETEFTVEEPGLAVQADHDAIVDLGLNAEGPEYEIVHPEIEDSLADLDASIAAHDVDIAAPQEGPDIPGVPLGDIPADGGLNPLPGADPLLADPFDLPECDPYTPNPFIGGSGSEPFGG